MLTHLNQSLAKNSQFFIFLFLIPILGFGVSQSASAQCVPANFSPNWLQTQEQAGGHTLARHVGWTNQQLVNRLISSPQIANASTYTNQGIATTNIQAALRYHKNNLNNWASNPNIPVGATRVVDYKTQSSVGRVAFRPPILNNIRNSADLRIVMRKSNGAGGCIVLTSYPI
jgi:hypothetical protein